MMTLTRFRALALPLVGASLLFTAGGCANPKTAPPIEAPIVTSAVVPRAPAPVVAVSPNVNVSEELAAACKLQFDDVASAPKFDFDRSAMGAQDNDMLAQIAKCVTTGPLAGGALALIGRADSRGEREYNMALGERRASSVRDVLSGLGVDSGRISDSSRGELDAIGTDEAGWQSDRRVDVLLR
jgi:peptidoglycan-associated lipoprotein